MGQIVKLIELVERLAELDDEHTIYACEPWTEESDAMAAHDDPESADFGIPREAADVGMRYFLEISIAREVLEGFIAHLDVKPTLAASCQRLIEYAINDA